MADVPLGGEGLRIEMAEPTDITTTNEPSEELQIEIAEPTDITTTNEPSEELQIEIEEPTDITTTNEPTEEQVPLTCPKCNLDLAKHSNHNRDIHIKWCGHKKASNSKRKSVKASSPSKEAASFASYFIKKKKSNDHIETDTPSTSPLISPPSSDRSIFNADQNILNEPDENENIIVSESGEDEDHVDQKLYCTGIIPAVMKDNVFNLFPFQLLPDLETVVFSGNAIHHIECHKRNLHL